MVDIRKATVDDNEDLIEIQQKCPQGTDMVINIDRSPDFFARISPYENAICFVAEVEGNIAGAAQCAFRELNFGGEQVKAVYEMGYIVDPTYRRRGIASQLHEAIEEYSRGQDTDIAHLNIVESNTPSMRLFEKHGFINWGENQETVIIPQKRQKNEKLVNFDL
jgi:RimJ/RimL family protein N-acetyltransferase